MQSHLANVGVLTAVADSAEHLKLISWSVDPSGSVHREGDSGNQAGHAPDISLARVFSTFDFYVTAVMAGGVASVVQGLSDVYVHAGGQYDWDSAAPVAVARAAGLHTSSIDGSPLVYNQSDSTLPDLVVCRPEYADAVLKITA